MNNYEINTTELKNNLINKGFAKLPSIKDYIKNNSIADKISSEMGDKNFMEASTFHMEFIKNLKLDKSVIPILFDIAKYQLNYKGDLTNQYHVSRKVSPGDSKECYRAHFDSHLFTIVFPLKIPTSRQKDPCGELIIFPNVRSNPKYEIQNVISKLWYKKYASKTKLEELSKNKQMVLINFHDYCPIIFRGNTFLHTNKELSESANHHRLTCLSHFFDPFASFGIGSFLRKIRSR